MHKFKTMMVETPQQNYRVEHCHLFLEAPKDCVSHNVMKGNSPSWLIRMQVGTVVPTWTQELDVLRMSVSCSCTRNISIVVTMGWSLMYSLTAHVLRAKKKASRGTENLLERLFLLRKTCVIRPLLKGVRNAPFWSFFKFISCSCMEIALSQSWSLALLLHVGYCRRESNMRNQSLWEKSRFVRHSFQKALEGKEQVKKSRSLVHLFS